MALDVALASQHELGAVLFLSGGMMNRKEWTERTNVKKPKVILRLTGF